MPEGDIVTIYRRGEPFNVSEMLSDGVIDLEDPAMAYEIDVRVKHFRDKPALFLWRPLAESRQ